MVGVRKEQKWNRVDGIGQSDTCLEHLLMRHVFIEYVHSSDVPNRTKNSPSEPFSQLKLAG